MTETTFTMHIDKELHRQLKIRVAALGITLKDYFLNFVKSDLYNEDEIHSFEDFNEETQKAMLKTSTPENTLLINSVEEYTKLEKSGELDNYDFHSFKNNEDFFKLLRS